MNFFVMRSPKLLEHGGATWQHDIAVQIHAEVNVTLHDVLGSIVVDSLASLTETLGWEKNIRATAKSISLSCSKKILLKQFVPHDNKTLAGTKSLRM